jgi:hypothetical protein
MQCKLAIQPRPVSSFHPEFVPGRDQLVTPAQAASGFTVLEAVTESLVLTTTALPVRPWGSPNPFYLRGTPLLQVVQFICSMKTAEFAHINSPAYYFRGPAIPFIYL